jgi:hypothetical protein
MSTVLDKNIQFEQVGKVMLKYHVCTLNNVRENRRAQQNGQSMDTVYLFSILVPHETFTGLHTVGVKIRNENCLQLANIWTNQIEHLRF